MMNPPMMSNTPSAPAAHISERPTDAAVRQRVRESATAAAKQTSASTGRSHARTPTARAMAIVVSANAWSPIDASVTDTSDDTGARSGATTASAPVTTAPASARRRAIESASPSVRTRWVAWTAVRVGTRQEVTAGDPRRDRLDERTDRDEVRILANELVGDRRTELGGDRIVAPDLVDVVGERRAVEHFAIEVSGEQSEGSEDGTEDDEDRARRSVSAPVSSSRLSLECQLRGNAAGNTPSARNTAGERS